MTPPCRNSIHVPGMCGTSEKKKKNSACANVVHVLGKCGSRHFPSKLFVYILQILQKFRIFLDISLDTRVVFFMVFHTSLGHLLHFYICVAYLFRTFTHKLFVYILQMLWNFRIFLGHLPRHHVKMQYMSWVGTENPKKNNPGVRVNVPKNVEVPEHLQGVYKEFGG